MKKVALFVMAIAVVSICATSCKKDCKCVTKMNGQVIGETTTKVKKSECEGLSATVNVGGMEEKTECAVE